MKVGIIGCGLIGQKRAKTLRGKATLEMACDLELNRAQALAKDYPEAKTTTQWLDVTTAPDINLVIIAVTHDLLPEIALSAIEQGKHVLIEKPAARCAQELLPLIEAAKRNQVLVRIGFNHRYHRALQKAKQLLDDGLCGDLMFIRGRYGHGGRIGYDKEWRANPLLSGGGELIDQGVHMIDLARWFLGDFTKISGSAQTYYWDMPVDDNAFLLLETAQKQVAQLQVSCTEWKNLFSLEIYGKKGKIDISGLGGSYGVEKITFYKMLPEMGPPETMAWEYPMADNSWQLEIDNFLEDIRANRQPEANLNDAYQALLIVDTIYRSSGYAHYS